MLDVAKVMTGDSSTRKEMAGRLLRRISRIVKNRRNCRNFSKVAIVVIAKNQLTVCGDVEGLAGQRALIRKKINKIDGWITVRNQVEMLNLLGWMTGIEPTTKSIIRKTMIGTKNQIIGVDIGQCQAYRIISTCKFLIQIGEGDVRSGMRVGNRKVGSAAASAVNVQVLNQERTSRDCGDIDILQCMIGILQIKHTFLASVVVTGIPELDINGFDMGKVRSNNNTAVIIPVVKKSGQRRM